MSKPVISHLFIPVIVLASANALAESYPPPPGSFGQSGGQLDYGTANDYNAAPMQDYGAYPTEPVYDQGYGAYDQYAMPQEQGYMNPMPQENYTFGQQSYGGGYDNYGPAPVYDNYNQSYYPAQAQNNFNPPWFNMNGGGPNNYNSGPMGFNPDAMWNSMSGFFGGNNYNNNYNYYPNQGYQGHQNYQNYQQPQPNAVYDYGYVDQGAAYDSNANQPPIPYDGYGNPASNYSTYSSAPSYSDPIMNNTYPDYMQPEQNQNGYNASAPAIDNFNITPQQPEYMQGSGSNVRSFPNQPYTGNTTQTATQSSGFSTSPSTQSGNMNFRPPGLQGQ